MCISFSIINTQTSKYKSNYVKSICIYYIQIFNDKIKKFVYVVIYQFLININSLVTLHKMLSIGIKIYLLLQKNIFCNMCYIIDGKRFISSEEFQKIGSEISPFDGVQSVVFAESVLPHNTLCTCYHPLFLLCEDTRWRFGP